MKLDELIDIETQVLADREADAESLRKRDEQLRRSASKDVGSRAERLRLWIHGIREARQTSLPGETVKKTYSAIRLAVALFAAIFGWGLAEAALHFEGGHPINILAYLWIFVFIQIAAVVFTIGATALLGLTSTGLDRLPSVALLRSAVRAVTRFAWNRWAREKDEERKSNATRIWNQLLERRSLYHPAERWLVVEILQWGAIAFNIAAIIRLVTLVAFSDLAFAWSTTLDLSATTFQSMLHALTLPWQALFPGAVPTEALVDATRYSRLLAAYQAGETTAAASSQLAGQWWKFLLAATITWGLIPRILFVAYARFKLGRFLNGLSFQTPEFAALDRRLTRAGVEMVNLSEDPGDDSPLPKADAVVLKPSGRSRCLTTLWREADVDEQIVRDWLDREFGYETTEIRRTGSADYAADEAFFATVKQQTPEAIAIVVEAWESPEKATLNFVKRVRAEAGDNIGIVVLLIDGNEFEQKLWIDYLGQLRDPYLQVTTP